VLETELAQAEKRDVEKKNGSKYHMVRLLRLLYVLSSLIPGQILRSVASFGIHKRSGRSPCPAIPVTAGERYKVKDDTDGPQNVKSCSD
jgi:hypothetical protein